MRVLLAVVSSSSVGECPPRLLGISCNADCRPRSTTGATSKGVIPIMSTVDADVSLLCWEKNDHCKALSDSRACSEKSSATYEQLLFYESELLRPRPWT